MADDLTKRGKPDRIRVSTTEEWEQRYWCDKFEVDLATLIAAVEAVGPMVKDVKAYLER